MPKFLHSLSRISPTLVDALMVFFYIKSVTWIQTSLFQDHSAKAGWIIVGFFGLLCIGVILFNLLKDEKKTAPPLFGYPAVGFVIIIFMMMIQAIGVFDGASAVSDTQGGVLSLVLILLAIVYVTALLGDVTGRIAPRTASYAIIQFLALLIVAGMIMMAGAYWEFALFEQAALAEKTLSQKIFMMLLTYPIFLLFFASPRLIFLTKNFSWYGLLSALGSIGYYVWVSVRHINF